MRNQVCNECGSHGRVFISSGFGQRIMTRFECYSGHEAESQPDTCSKCAGTNVMRESKTSIYGCSSQSYEVHECQDCDYRVSMSL